MSELINILDIRKECKEALNNVKLEEIQEAIEAIKKDNSICYHINLYRDSANNDFMFCIGADIEGNIFYKLGILEANTMFLDISDILLPYDEVNNYIYDSEYTIDDTIDSKEWQYIKNTLVRQFISYCVNNGLLDRTQLFI